MIRSNEEISIIFKYYKPYIKRSTFCYSIDKSVGGPTSAQWMSGIGKTKKLIK